MPQEKLGGDVGGLAGDVGHWSGVGAVGCGDPGSVADRVGTVGVGVGEVERQSVGGDIRESSAEEGHVEDLEGSKIDTTGNVSVLCNMNFRGLGKGAGEHNEAQQEAGGFEEVHDFLFVGRLCVAKRLKL